jgi:hypothetical protein
MRARRASLRCSSEVQTPRSRSCDEQFLAAPQKISKKMSQPEPAPRAPRQHATALQGLIDRLCGDYSAQQLGDFGQRLWVLCLPSFWHQGLRLGASFRLALGLALYCRRLYVKARGCHRLSKVVGGHLHPVAFTCEKSMHVNP